MKSVLQPLAGKGVVAAGIYLVSSALARAGAVLLVPIYTRRLTLEEYGDYAIAQTIVGILPTLLSFGLLTAVSRFYFDGVDRRAAEEKTGATARSLVFVTVAAATLVQVVLLLAHRGTVTGLFGRWEMSCILWAGAGASIGAVPSTYLRASQRPLLAAGLQLFSFCSALGGGILFVAVLNRGLRGAIEAVAVSACVDGLVGTVFIALRMRGRPSTALVREGVRFGLPFVPHVLANQAQQIADRWIMKGVGLQAALGSYALAGQLCAPVGMTVVAWNDAEAPRVGEIFRAGGLAAIRREARRIAGRYVLAALIPGVALVAALPLLELFVGERFGASLWLVPWLCALWVADSLYFPGHLVLFYADRTAAIPKVTVAAAVVNVVLNAVLIRALGIPGALLSRAASIAVKSGVMWLAARQNLIAAKEPESR